MEERRNNDRLLCAELVQVHYQDLSGRPQKVVANLEDISQRGLCLQVEKQIPDGSPIVITHERGDLAGVVRYCAFRDGSFFLGIEFAEGSQWTTTEFCPKHLLNPKELVESVLNSRDSAI